MRYVVHLSEQNKEIEYYILQYIKLVKEEFTVKKKGLLAVLVIAVILIASILIACDGFELNLTPNAENVTYKITFVFPNEADNVNKTVKATEYKNLVEPDVPDVPEGHKGVWSAKDKDGAWTTLTDMLAALTGEGEQTVEFSLYPRYYQEYTITYDFNGGSPIAGKEYVSKYIEIDIVKLEGAELQGKKFLGWYNATDEGETIITEIKYSTGDLTLKAKWEDATP
jgi:uncharacterized repeat protein (TIGR02543 family)